MKRLGQERAKRVDRRKLVRAIVKRRAAFAALSPEARAGVYARATPAVRRFIERFMAELLPPGADR